MNRTIIVMALCVITLGAGITQAQELWVGKDGNIRNIDTRAMIIGKGGLYLATRNEIYRAREVNEKWEEVFRLPSGENEIRCMAGGARNILVGTTKGLFRSDDYGKNWRNVFRTIIPDKNNILAIELSKHNPRKVMVGTEKGVFLSMDFGDKWQDVSENIRNKNIKCIALNKECTYTAGDDGLYIKMDGSSGWERIYVHSPAEKNSAEEPSGEPYEGEEDSASSINCIAIKDSRLYIGIDKNILYSDDRGKEWKTFTSEGLSGIVNYIAVSNKPDKLYAATTKGIFEFISEKGADSGGRWRELYKGMDKAVFVSKLVLDTEGGNFLWALTDKGLYRLESGRYTAEQYIDVEKNMKTLKIIFDNEPGFKELQKAAMKFAEVDPEKIKNWRNQARIKALLPKVGFGIDKNRSTTAEIYTSATKDYIVTGPDDMTDGFDVSVSWELGDLIWSDDQTNIDVRSRLTTQLRNDILDDLRRAYYERKRLQFEIMQAPPKDPKARFEKELRIQELTQAIDDLTGNYLSEHIKGPTDAPVRN